MKFSIITVAYNSEATIRGTVESIAGQSYKNYEHLVIDGASTDQTVNVVQNLSTSQLRLISEPDNGLYDAMNKGIRYAAGEIIGILNSDDFYVHSNVLSEVANAFSLDPSLDVVLGDVDFVESSNVSKPVRIYRAKGFKPWMFRFGLMPPHPAVFVRKSAYERVGNYKLGYKIAADFDLLVRLLSISGAKYSIAGQHWVRMRIGGASTTGWRSNFIITREMQRSLKENNIFSCIPMLLIRLPIKFIGQIL